MSSRASAQKMPTMMMPLRYARQALILLGLILALTFHCTHALRRPFSNRNVAIPPAPPAAPMEMPESEVPQLLGEKDDEQETDYAAETVATLQVLYGTALLLYGKDFPEQMLCLTMMRATGFSTLEAAVRTARKNLRRAIRFAIWRAPSFLKLRSSILHIHDRIDDVKREMAATRKAKEDGVITPDEERQLKRMHKRDLRLLRRDRRRIQGGMVNVGKFLRILDLETIFEIIKSFLYQFVAVLSAGHSKSKLCIMICRWCHFLSLGSLLVDSIQKLMTSIEQRRTFLDRIHKRISIGLLGKTAIMIFAFYLVETHNVFARRLNAALLEAAIILRGLRYFVDAAWDRDEDTILATLAKRLERTGGGLLIAVLAAMSLFFVDRDNMWTPRILLAPMEAIESGISTLADIFL